MNHYGHDYTQTEYDVMLKSQLAQAQMQAQAQGQGNAFQAKRPIEPIEPTMLGQATELLNYVATLETHAASLRGVLFGEGKGVGPGILPPSTLQGLLADACQRVASLCGELATIKGELGCDPMREASPNIAVQSQRR